jgi:ABC-type transporter Mla MlaB component
MELQTGQLDRRDLAALVHIDELTSDVDRLSLDLRDVERADSELMAKIVLLARRCRARGAVLSLVGSASVLAWIELCQLEGVVDLVRR